MSMQTFTPKLKDTATTEINPIWSERLAKIGHGLDASLELSPGRMKNNNLT